MKSIKLVIDSLWEKPFFYNLLHSTLAGGELNLIGNFLKGQIPEKTRKILDQGCGTGKYALFFKNKYTGLDNNPDYIKTAQKKYPGNFILGNALKMPFTDQKFDITFAVGLHHHLNKSQARGAIEEALRVTKNKGKVIIVDAMLPKSKFNIFGLFLRKMDRGGNVRKSYQSLELLPDSLNYKTKILSKYPFDYIAITIVKK